MTAAAVALVLIVYTAGCLYALMAWWGDDLAARHHRLARPPLRPSAALQLRYQGVVGRAYRDWSAWTEPKPVADVVVLGRPPADLARAA